MNRLLMCLSISLSVVACGTEPVLPIDGGRDPATGDAASADSGAVDAPTSGDGGVAPDAPRGDGGTLGCPRTAAAADRVRRVVVSHPYDDTSEDSNQYEVLELAVDGTLSRPAGGTTFEMGRAFQGQVSFTPDGEVGIVPQEDGSLGVFRLAADGTPSVVHARYVGGFYAGPVVMDPSGTGAWVLDSQWRENGGGIYRIEIGCDGTIVSESLVAAARLPYGMALLPEGRAVVASHDLLAEPIGRDVHVVDLEAPSIVASGEVLADSDWIIAGFAIAGGGRHVLLGDNASFSKTGNRIAVAEIVDGTITGVQQIPAIEDPLSIVASPFDDVVLVVSGFGDAILLFDYDRAAAMPLAARGEPTYSGAPPALPGTAVLIDRGTLRGLVLIAENVGVRRMRFGGEGAVTDLGSLSLGEGTSAIVGAVGVQP